MCKYLKGNECECPYTMNSVCNNLSDCEYLETEEE